MISLILSTQSRLDLGSFQANVAATIGVPFEIIVIENPGGTIGLAEAYNRGALQAGYPILCFLHDDIIFLTQNWGRVVVDLLSDASVGVLGLAGAVCRSHIPGDWANSKFIEANVIQQFKRSQREKLHIHASHSGNNPAQVAVCDGLWMCVRKDVFELHRFDTQSFPGFHGYDLDFSFSVAQTHKNLVTFEILVEHLSEGDFNSSWLESAFSFQKKWASRLPFEFEKHSPRFWRQFDNAASRSMLKHLVRCHSKTGSVLQHLVSWHLGLKANPLLLVRDVVNLFKYKLRMRYGAKPL